MMFKGAEGIKGTVLMVLIAFSASMCTQEPSARNQSDTVSSTVSIKNMQDSLARKPKQFIPGAACCKGGAPSRAKALASQM